MLRLAVCLLGMLAFTPLQCQPAAVEVAEPHAGPPAKPAGPDDSVSLSEPDRQLIGLELEQVSAKECRSTLKAMGKLVAPQTKTAIVGYAFSGRVSEVHVQIGDWVEKGQRLLTLESQEVGTAKCDFFKAVADLELATLNFEREKRLLDSGIGIEKNFAAAEAELKIAQENRDAAHKRLHVLGFDEKEVEAIAKSHQIHPAITLFAPLAGKIVKNDAVLGALVDQATQLMTVIDPTTLWVDAQIYENDLAKVKVGQKVEVRVPAYPDEVFAGSVTFISDVVDDQSRTIAVRAEVDNAEQRLKPGMFADIGLLLMEDQQALVVPRKAVLEEGLQQVVFVKTGDAFVSRAVQTSAIDGDCLQVVAGLKAGEEIVTVGNHLLRSRLKQGVLEQAGHHHGHGHGHDHGHGHGHEQSQAPTHRHGRPQP
ncbi:MAG: efflux RND transporter periplasmic adaptor subunit [Candidatus Anammoximicrobium sp.]|nr:efflux RND transporter periplasmic adaptor subunit [Candidatus Anammoximicrobium sp.]